MIKTLISYPTTFSIHNHTHSSHMHPTDCFVKICDSYRKINNKYILLFVLPLGGFECTYSPFALFSCTPRFLNTGIFTHQKTHMTRSSFSNCMCMCVFQFELIGAGHWIINDVCFLFSTRNRFSATQCISKNSTCRSMFSLPTLEREYWGKLRLILAENLIRFSG